MSVNKVLRRCLSALTHKSYLDFSEVMSIALYGEGVGYYMGSKSPFGEKGDFVTAPIISDVFSCAVAEWIQDMGISSVLEIGSGNGVMGKAILASSPNLTEYVSVDCGENASIETSTIASRRKTVPPRWCGGVVANELLDALPVRRFCWSKNEGLREFVLIKDQQSVQMTLRPTIQLNDIMPDLEKRSRQWQSPYIFEHCFEVEHLFKKLSGCLGPLLFIDYGYEVEEYFHPDRLKGSLMCFKSHRVIPFSLKDLGQFDMTAAVNWSYVMDCAQRHGFKVECFGPQSDFLRLYGHLEKASPKSLKQLMMPEEMGQYIKVLSLST